MEISYKWLKEYVDFDLTPQETADALTSCGLEVDTPFHKLFNLFGGIAHNLLNGTTVADKVAGNHSVLYMLVEIVNCKISY